MSIEVLVEGTRRRNWPVELKRQIVEESCRPDVSVCDVARRHDLDPSQLYAWRKQFREKAASLAAFVPIEVAEPLPHQVDDGGDVCSGRARSHKIEILLTNGRRLLVPCDIDTKCLKRLVQALDD